MTEPGRGAPAHPSPPAWIDPLPEPLEPSEPFRPAPAPGVPRPATLPADPPDAPTRDHSPAGRSVAAEKWLASWARFVIPNFR